MSGPIVRKYGFPNFEQIFGAREVEHGVEDEDAPAGPETESTNDSAAGAEASDSGTCQTGWGEAEAAKSSRRGKGRAQA
jgi:hypothetical protein